MNENYKICIDISPLVFWTSLHFADGPTEKNENIRRSWRRFKMELPSEALQEMRIKYRWKAIEDENKAIKEAKEKGSKYIPMIFENGDTAKQLLARSRYVLFKPSTKWTDSQKVRADILFKYYPDLKKAYNLSMAFRGMYERSDSIQITKLNTRKLV
jgi:hypothetical protein